MLAESCEIRDLREGLPLPGTPWSVRFASGGRGRRALELYEDGLLLDVMVAGSLDRTVLRGARAVRGRALAWGLLPAAADGEDPAVLFQSGLLRQLPVPATTFLALDAFWLATADSPATRVRVTTPEGATALRVRRG